MGTIKVEYLVTVDQKDPFCNSITTFNHYLRSIDGLRLKNSQMEIGTLHVGYEVQTGEISRDKHRFFHVRLTLVSEDELTDFDDLLRKIRTVLARANGKPVIVLWDGVSFFYAQKAYPLIYEIENLMRRLISKFMHINVGLGWTNEAIPQEVADSIRAKGQRNSQNYLFEVDFIQLSNFLFKEYATLTPSALFEKIRSAKESSELDLEVLKSSLPRSNWERYFSRLVNCESEYLRIRWERLYERRNQVAHSRGVTESEYRDIATLVSELQPKLQEAIDKLDQISIPDEERELVAENAAINKNALYGQFLLDWSHFQQSLFKLADPLSSESREENRRSALRFDMMRMMDILTRHFGGTSVGDISDA